MKVLKFGGTSVGSAQRMRAVAQIIADGERKMVVLSAMSGTTNSLVKLADYLKNKNLASAQELILGLEGRYLGVVEELLVSVEFRAQAKLLVTNQFEVLRGFMREVFTGKVEKLILAQGELLSTGLFHYLLLELGRKSTLLSALEFMRVDKDGDPDGFYIRENVMRLVGAHRDTECFVTQGFICRNAYGDVDNLQRGGSDYSASLIGAALRSEEIQIWTDIDGFHNNDPRVVDNTRPLAHLSFDEAAELAYFGAKIMHPSSVLPAKLANIAVRLKNTLEPSDEGTLISADSVPEGIRAVAAKDGITAINIKSGRMLMAYGFLRKVFEVFEVYKTPIDMITTSEVAVSVTIDDKRYLNPILQELKKYGTVEVDENLTIVCVVGNFEAERAGLAAELFDAVRSVPVRMISYGGSPNNISMLVKQSQKKAILQALNDNLLQKLL